MLFVPVVNVVNFQLKFCYCIVIIPFNHKITLVLLIIPTLLRVSVYSSYWHTIRLHVLIYLTLFHFPHCTWLLPFTLKNHHWIEIESSMASHVQAFQTVVYIWADREWLQQIAEKLRVYSQQLLNLNLVSVYIQWPFIGIANYNEWLTNTTSFYMYTPITEKQQR